MVYPTHGQPGEQVTLLGHADTTFELDGYLGSHYLFSVWPIITGDIDGVYWLVPDLPPGQYSVVLNIHQTGQFCTSVPFTVDALPPATTTTTTTFAPPTTAAPTTTATPTTAPPPTTSPPVTAAGTTLPPTTTLLTTTTRLVTTTRPATTTTREPTTTTSTTIALATTTTGLPEPTTSLPEPITPVPSTLLAGDVTDDGSGSLLPVILAFLGGVAAVLLVGLGWWLARHRYAGMNGGEPSDG